MRKSLQNEIPKSRINIQLDVETGSAIEKKELPMKLLVIGDFSQGRNQEKLKKREKVSVSKNNLDKVLSDFSPNLSLIIKNTLNGSNEDIQINLNFSSFNDFNPQSLAHQIPALRKLIAMRNLLKELKSNILDDLTLCRKLEAVLNDQVSRDVLSQKLSELSPIDDMKELTGVMR